MAPVVISPAPVASVEAVRLGNRVYVRFAVPVANTDQSRPADLDRIDVYALTTDPDRDPSLPPPLEDWLDAATLVATFTVLEEVPPRGDEDAAEERRGEEESPRLDDDDARGAHVLEARVQGETVTLVEALTPESMTPFVFEDDFNDDDDEALDDQDVMAGPLVSPPLPSQPRRTYLVQGVSSRGREGAPSQRVAVSLAPPAPRPAPPRLSYTQAGISVEWEPVPGARLPIQRPTPPEWLASFPAVPVPEPTTYLLYTADARLAGTPVLPQPLNPPPAPVPVAAFPPPSAALGPTAGALGPTAVGAGGAANGLAAGAPLVGPAALSTPPAPTIIATSFVHPGVPYGVERCYVVRTRTLVDELPVIGLASPPTCVVPVDSFPPSPPLGLIAVAGEAAISLVWDPGTENDLAGYNVLRRTTSDDTLQPLTTVPIEGTAYRDSSVVPGERYVYAVQAVDNAVPSNVSAASIEVIEQAR